MDLVVVEEEEVVFILAADVDMIIKLAAAAVPTAHPAQMRPVQQAYGRGMVRWLLPIALASALNLRRWWPIIIM